MVAVTSDSVTLMWLPGQDGGHPQTFTVFLRQAGTTSFIPYQPTVEILDQGQGHLMKHVVSGLEPDTVYMLKVRARNAIGSIHSLYVDAHTLGR